MEFDVPTLTTQPPELAPRVVRRRSLLAAVVAAPLLAACDPPDTPAAPGGPSPEFALRGTVDPEIAEACRAPSWPRDAADIGTYRPLMAARGYVLPPLTLLDTSHRSGIARPLGPWQPWLPPKALGDGSLNRWFRDAAASKSPAWMLTLAASWFLAGGAVRDGGVSRFAADPLPPHSDQERVVWGNAFADLAVTGRAAFARFTARPPTVDEIAGAVPAQLRLRGLEATPAAYRAAAVLALQRAYRVAYAVRSGALIHQPAARRELGYVAVAQTDPPHRPVNVPAAEVQFDVPLRVWDADVVVRCTAWSSSGPQAPQWPPPPDPREGWHARAYADPAPPLPGAGEVVVYVHGHGSRAEEGQAVARGLVRGAARRGRSLTVLAFDLPGTGYSTHVTAEQLHRGRELGARGHRNLFALSYYDAVVPSVVEALGLRGRVSAVVGGSLGGNIVLRLAQRSARRAHPWLRQLVAWSPASVWPSFDIDGPLQKRAVAQIQDRPAEAEDQDSRWDYFHAVFVADGVPFPQAETWYRRDWTPCRTFVVAESVLDRFEVYSEPFRRWHWRMAAEQLILSHRANDTRNGLPPNPATSIVGPLLLVTGAEDKAPLVNIPANTAKLAAGLRGRADGRWEEWRHTGHSVQAERPLLLAERILDVTRP